MTEKYPPLKPFINEGTIDFKSSVAMRTLSSALLAVDFGLLNVELPVGKLCPTIPNRIDYIHFIEDLLERSGLNYNQDSIHGLDIGTGASCIYPLLGCSLHDNWKFTATEIDPTSVSAAIKNVDNNGLSYRIQLIHVQNQSDPLISSLQAKFDFCICNPPFYSSSDDIEMRRNIKSEDSSTLSEYTASESVFPGGEVAFIKRIIEESHDCKNQIRWFTTLVGIKENVLLLEKELRGLQIPQVEVLYSQVGVTRRWILAWSFFPKQKLDRKQKLLSANIIFPSNVDVNSFFKDTFFSLNIKPLDKERYCTDFITWSRNARRDKELGRPLKLLHMEFQVKIIGQVAKFTPTKPSDYKNLNDLVNSIKSQIKKPIY